MAISPQRLHALLQRQHDAAQRLLRLLTEEHAAITGNNLQDMESILAAKQQSLMELETTSLECAQVANNKTALIRIIRQSDPHGSLGLESIWRRIETLLRQCQGKNSVNGKISYTRIAGLRVGLIRSASGSGADRMTGTLPPPAPSHCRWEDRRERAQLRRG